MICYNICVWVILLDIKVILNGENMNKYWYIVKKLQIDWFC